jgi:predicted metal-dependent enzyme (double-stranded beta helix superfamily)
MSSPTVPPATVVPSPSPRDSGATAHAAQLSAELAGACAAAPARWRSLVHHEPGSRWYVRLDDVVADLVLDDPAPGALSAWLITWAPGTGLDLHDHGGSVGSVAVVGGQLTERYGRLGADGHLRGRLRRRRLGLGSITTFGPDHVHEVRNDGITPAVSIHVYVPGLTDMAFYDAPAASRPGVRTHTADTGDLT